MGQDRANVIPGRDPRASTGLVVVAHLGSAGLCEVCAQPTAAQWDELRLRALGQGAGPFAPMWAHVASPPYHQDDPADPSRDWATAAAESFAEVEPA